MSSSPSMQTARLWPPQIYYCFADPLSSERLKFDPTSQYLQLSASGCAAAPLGVSDIEGTAHPPFLFLFLHNAHLQIVASLRLRTPACSPLGHHRGNWKESKAPPQNGLYKTTLTTPACLTPFPSIHFSSGLRKVVLQLARTCGF